MNFWKYIDRSQAEFEVTYIDTRLVQRQHHPTFPLDIYTYGREAVHESHWDEVTMKCRGIVVNRETGDIVARPFEKFFNFGSTELPGLTSEDVEAMDEQPVVWEKMDGFLCTVYVWEGKPYVASKGSFTSPHAKWATHWIQNNCPLAKGSWPTSVTAVFEGICPSLRIVVDYGKREEMVLLAVIDNETGEELGPNGGLGQPHYTLQAWAERAGVTMARRHDLTWQSAYQNSYDETLKNEEGYVLTWYRAGQTPFRLKMKFADYLRIHRMVTGVSPKRILEVLQNGWTSEMDGLLNESTPWFNKFVAKWKRIIEGEYQRIDENSTRIFENVKAVIHSQYLSTGILPTRKDFALLYTHIETNREFAPVLFAMFDGKNKAEVIWKMVRNNPIMKGGRPMVDDHAL